MLLIRQAVTRPLHALLIVVVIALGIGPTLAVFSIADSILFRSPPIDDPASVVRVFRVDETGRPAGNMNFPLFEDLREHATSFSQVAAFQMLAVNVGGQDVATMRIRGSVVTGDYFAIFRVPPMLGRTIGPHDDRDRGGHPVTVVSEGFWRTHLGAAPEAVGSTIQLNGAPYTVIGVMPARFAGEVAGGVNLWMPMAMMETIAYQPWEIRGQRSRSWHDVVARLSPGVTREAAEAEVDGLVAGILETTGGNARFMRYGLLPLTAAVTDPYGNRGIRRNAILLAALTFTLFVIAISNAASLMLVRAEERTREFAVRIGIGATYARLTRMLTAEAAAYAAVGAATGLVVAVAGIWIALPWLNSVLAGQITDIHLLVHWRVFAFASALLLAATLAAVVAPVWRIRKLNINASLKGGALREAGRTAVIRNGVTWAQIALSVSLVALALLLVRSLWHTTAIDPGFDPRNSLVATLDLRSHMGDVGRVHDEVTQRLLANPDVESVAFASTLPVDSSSMVSSFTLATSPDLHPSTSFSAVSPAFFKQLGIPLLAGRTFARADSSDAPAVAIVNRTFAERYFDGDAVGQGFEMLGHNLEIVGVAADVKLESLREGPMPMAWVPIAQRPDPFASIVVRGRDADSWALVPVLREAVAAIDNDVPVFNLRTLEEHLGASYGAASAMAGILTAFAVLATSLAVLGLYGLLAWQVRVRTREIGIRVALGADSARVRTRFVGYGLGLTMLAVPAGLLAAAWVARGLDSWLFGVTPFDPVTAVSVLVGGLLTSVAAVWLPASRAANIDPAVALRDD